MLRVTLSAVLAFLLFLMLHFLDFYFLIPQEKVNHLLGAALIGLLSIGVFLWVFPNESWFQRKLYLNDDRVRRYIFPILGLLFYGFLFLGYLEFYFTADRSITFRMLMIVDKEKNYAITHQKMFELYDVPGVINKRFEDLVYGGYLTQKGNVYYLTSKGHVTLSIYRYAIEHLHLHSGEKKK